MRKFFNTIFTEGTTSSFNCVKMDTQMRNVNFEDWWSYGPGDGYERH